MKNQTIETSKDVAEVLKNRRKELGISQKDLAQLCDLSHNGISRIEVNDSDVQLSTLLKLSHFLGFKIIFEMEE
jgi:ribosome-binding protein aMBF1 (putative translation factor)